MFPKNYIIKNALFFLGLLFNSCQTEGSFITEEQESNFYALKVGNSWVYKNYRFNYNNLDYEDVNVIDSVSIIGAEFINGKEYFRFRTLTTGNESGIAFCNPNGEHFELLRDSLGFLVRDDGSIKFVNSEVTEWTVSESSLGSVHEILNENTDEVSVEAGTFNCLFSERYARNLSGEVYPGLDKFYYSRGIGLVYDTSSYWTSTNAHIKRELISYNIN